MSCLVIILINHWKKSLSQTESKVMQLMREIHFPSVEKIPQNTKENTQVSRLGLLNHVKKISNKSKSIKHTSASGLLVSLLVTPGKLITQVNMNQRK